MTPFSWNVCVPETKIHFICRQIYWSSMEYSLGMYKNKVIWHWISRSCFGVELKEFEPAVGSSVTSLKFLKFGPWSSKQVSSKNSVPLSDPKVLLRRNQDSRVREEIIHWEKNWVFVTNSDFLIPISLHLIVGDLRYFKLWIILDQIIIVWNIKVLHQ